MFSLVSDPLGPPWKVVFQASLFIGFPSQEYWSEFGIPFPPPRDLPDPRIEPGLPLSPALHTDSLPLNHQGSPVGIKGMAF